MPFAVTLGLDPQAAARVVAMWRELAARGVSDDALTLGYAPHVTMAILPDAAEQAILLAAALHCSTTCRPLPITLPSLGIFPGPPACCFLAPVLTHALRRCHDEVLASLPIDTVDPLYRPETWVPHVTLASDVVDAAAAVVALDPGHLPFTAVLDRIEVVRFRPVSVLATHRLRLS